MAELKTKVNDSDVMAFLNSISDERKRKDCIAISKLMQQITGSKPKMWGTAIVGFGSYHYKYESGHEGDTCLAGFSPRKQNITIYLMGAVQNKPDLFKKLGKHKTGKECLYVNTLEDVDIDILKKLIEFSIDFVKKQSEIMNAKK